MKNKFLMKIGIIIFILVLGLNSNVHAMYQIFVKTKENTPITLNVNANNSIGEIKEKIEDRKQIIPQRQRLYFSERLLEDSNVVSEYNIQREAVLDLLIANNIIRNTENGSAQIDKEYAFEGENVGISNIVSNKGYRLKDIKILKSEDNVDVTTDVNYNVTNRIFVMPDYEVKVNVNFEKIPYTIIVIGENIIVSPTSPIKILYGDNKGIIIKAKAGYELTKVLVDNVEQTLPLTNDKITLRDIQKDIIINVDSKKLEIKDEVTSEIVEEKDETPKTGISYF